MNQPGRNDPCSCGSGMKYKKCCYPKEDSSRNNASRALSYSEIKQMIKSADSYPVERCIVNSDWKDCGFALVLAIRKQNNGNFMIGFYLVDVYCLGVKNTFCNAEFSAGMIEEKLLQECYFDHPRAEVSLDYARSIVFGAIDYAGKLGFEPHPDFHLSRNILGKEEKITGCDDVRFGGPEGKPLYIAGPDDNVQAVLSKLTKRLGKDGYHFVVPVETGSI